MGAGSAPYAIILPALPGAELLAARRHRDSPRRNMQPITDTNLILRALIIMGLIALGFYVAADQGALALALGSDNSYISHLILALYGIACGHWLWLARQLGRERQGLAGLRAPSG